MRLQGLQHRPRIFRGLKSLLRRPVFCRSLAVCLFTALLALAALPASVQAQTTNSPSLGGLTVNGNAATVVISSFHYNSSTSNNLMNVEVCRVTTTGQLDDTNCAVSYVVLSSSSAITFDLTDNPGWPSGASGSRYVRARTFTTPTSGSSYYSPWSNQRIWHGAARACNETNSPPVNLGTLGLSRGSTLTHSGTLEGRYYEAPCHSPSNSWRAARFFRFTIGPNDAGAVTIAAPKNQSTMLSALFLRRGTAYSGGVVWQDDNAVNASYPDDALAGGLLDAGTYTLELRNGNTDMTSANPAEAGGAYDITITRLQPEASSIYATPSGVHTTWDLGTAVRASHRGAAANSIALAVKVDYRLKSESGWTSSTTNLAPDDGGRTVLNDISGLTFGETYLVRAGYTNATHYESIDQVTEAFIRLSASPYRVEGNADLIDEEMTKYRIRVAWQTPEIELGEDLSYRYSTRLDGSDVAQNVAGQEQVLEATFDYAPTPGQTILEIEVNNTFTCDAAAASACELTYDGRDHEIPAGESWSTTWSAPGLVRFDDEAGGFGSQAASRDPDPAVTEAIDLVLEQVMVPEDSRQTETLAVLLGGLVAIAVGVAVGVLARGPAVNRVTLGAGITFTLLGGVISVLFGFPDELTAILAALAMILGSAFLVRRFAFE